MTYSAHERTRLNAAANELEDTLGRVTSAGREQSRKARRYVVLAAVSFAVAAFALVATLGALSR